MKRVRCNVRDLTGMDYHRARAAAEMLRAAEAADPKTAALHRELAALHLLSAGDGEDLEQPAPVGTAKVA